MVVVRQAEIVPLSTDDIREVIECLSSRIKRADMNRIQIAVC